MARCPSCGEEAGDGLFCGYCGAKAPSEPSMPEAAEVQPQEAAAGWTCSRCAADNDLDARFCHACGAGALSASPSVAASPSAPSAGGWTCANCGAVGEDDADFCYTCGSRRPVASTAVAGVGAATSFSVTAPSRGSAPGMPSQPAAGAGTGPATSTPASTPSVRPATSAPRRSSRLPWGMAAVAVVVLAAAGVAYMVGRGEGGGTSAAQTSAVASASSDSDSASGSGSGQDVGSTSAPAPETETEPEPEPEPSNYTYSAPTGDASDVVIAARVAGLSQAEGVAATLSRYYGGINARNWSQVWAQYTPAYQREHGSVDRLANDARTSRDFDAAIHSITRLDSHMMRAYVTFTSTQAGSLGPVKGETRTDWRLDYDFRRVDGEWLINGTKAHSGSGHSPG